MFSFDYSINIGNILTLVSLLSVFVVAHSKNVRRMERIETKLGVVFDWFRTHVIANHERRDCKD